MDDGTSKREYVDNFSDSIEDLDAEIAAQHPELNKLIAAAEERRALLRDMAAARKRSSIPQAVVAHRMGTSQAFVSRLERGVVDPQHSTEDRYAAAIGMKVERRLVKG
jgi:DNA-binding transcriptional regulator YiaG